MKELLSKSVWQLDTLESKVDVFRHMETVIKAKKGRFESIHRKKDGITFPVEVSTTFLPAGGEGRFVCIIRDITDVKRNEEIRE